MTAPLSRETQGDRGHILEGSLCSWGAQHVCPPGPGLLCGPVWPPPDVDSIRAQQANHDTRGAGPSPGAEVTHCLAHSGDSAQPHSQAPVRGDLPVRWQPVPWQILLEAGQPALWGTEVGGPGLGQWRRSHVQAGKSRVRWLGGKTSGKTSSNVASGICSSFKPTSAISQGRQGVPCEGAARS